MTLLSLCLAAASAAFAQSAPPSLATYAHASKGATLVLLTPAGETRPKALYYEGKRGRWLVQGSQLYDLGRDDGWAQIRYDIYYMQADGLAYMDDSYSSPSLRRWAEPDTVAWVESVIAKLAAKGLQEAPLACLSAAGSAGSAVAGAAASRSSLLTAAKLQQGVVLDPKRVEELGPSLDAARVAAARAKAECESAVKEAFGGAKPETVAPLFYASALDAASAGAAGENAQRELDGQRIPAY